MESTWAERLLLHSLRRGEDALALQLMMRSCVHVISHRPVDYLCLHDAIVGAAQAEQLLLAVSSQREALFGGNSGIASRVSDHVFPLELLLGRDQRERGGE